MEKRFVTVHTNNSRIKMELIQFITNLEGTVLAICMDEVGDIGTYPLEIVQGEGFQLINN